MVMQLFQHNHGPGAGPVPAERHDQAAVIYADGRRQLTLRLAAEFIGGFQFKNKLFTFFSEFF